MKKINKFLLIAFMSAISIGTASAQCAASFTAIDNGNGNHTFTSTSTGGVYFSWTIGGNYYSGASVSVTLPDGDYLVCLDITDSMQSCTNTHCDSIVVSGSPIPACDMVAGISYTDNGSGNYTFTSTTTATTYGPATSNYWNFGDSNSDNGGTVNHTFAANGTYIVVLNSQDSLTICADYATVVIVVTGVTSPVPCQAGFVVYNDSTQFLGLTVVNSSTGNGLSYSWDFGDGNTSTQQYPAYTYTTGGPFYLCLTVDDGNGCTSTYCDSIGSNGYVYKNAGFNINVTGATSTTVEEEIETVSNFNVFPNPINNNANIQFSLVDASTVEVFVTDLLGHKVAVIANETMNTGVNTLTWNVANVSNGVYLLNISTNNSLQVKKLIVNK